MSDIPAHYRFQRHHDDASADTIYFVGGVGLPKTVEVSGPGPDGHEPDPSLVKRARVLPPIYLDPSDL